MDVYKKHVSSVAITKSTTRYKGALRSNYCLFVGFPMYIQSSRLNVSLLQAQLGRIFTAVQNICEHII